MGRLEIVHDDKVLFDYDVDSYKLGESRDHLELTASFQPGQPSISGPYAEPAAGNLPAGLDVPDDTAILGEKMPGWDKDDDEYDDGR